MLSKLLRSILRVAGLLAVVALFAQTEGEITGQITDSTGTVPGAYSISVEATGFRSEVRRAVELQVQQTARLDFQMQVGQISEVVEIRGGAPRVANKRIVDLPLNGRNFLQLVSLSPNVSFGFIVATVGITKRIVPHQLRYSFGAEMLRAGVSFPAVMKLLGHLSPEMTMRYAEVCLLDLQREFHLARSQPRHLLPASRFPTSTSSQQANLVSLPDSLHLAQHVLEMFRGTLPQGPDRRLLDRLSNRLTKITSETRKLG